MENRKIVLLDDDMVSGLLLTKLVKSWMPKIPVDKFEEAPACLRALREKPLETKWLLFLEINMPQMNGWGFLQALTDKGFANVEVVITTSSIDVRDYGRAFEYPCVKQYLIKPIDAKHLRELSDSKVVPGFFA